MKAYTTTWNGVSRTEWRQGMSSGSSFQYVQAGMKSMSNVSSLSNKLNRQMGRPNNHSYLVDRRNNQSGSYVRRAKDGSFETRTLGQFNWPPTNVTPDTLVSDTVYNDCLASLYEQVRGELDLSIDLLQWRQTTKMVSDAFKVLRKTRDALLSARKIDQLIASSHKRDRANGRRWQRAFEDRYRKDLSKKLADNWLQWQYGVKPLMTSVYETAQRFAQPDQPVTRVRARKTRRDYRMRDAGNLTGTGVSTRVHSIVTKRCEIVAVLAFQPSVVDDLAKFSSLNPASIIWETIPYSFVIDWVYDVGSYLRNFESALLYANNFVSGYVTHTCREAGTCITQGTNDDGVWVTSLDTRGDFEATFKQRAVLAGIPFPRAPRFEPKLGWQRLVSAASLLRGFIRR